MTAAVILGLVDEDRLKLDDPVAAHLPGVRFPGDSRNRITVRHLLQHTAGWEGDWFLHHPAQTGWGDDALARVIDRLHEVPVVAPPGQVYAYNNVGYLVLGRLIEVMTGQVFEAAMHDRLFEPLKMTDAGFGAEHAITRRVALGHVQTAGVVDVLRENPWSGGWAMPRSDNSAGGVLASAADLLEWIAWLCGTGSPILTTTAMQAMRTPTVDAGERGRASLGWTVGGCGGKPLLRHGGFTGAYFSTIWVLPESGFGVAVLTNSDSAFGQTEPFLQGILEMVLGVAPDTPDNDEQPSSLEEFVGHFRSSVLGERVFNVDGNCLRMEEPGNPERVAWLEPCGRDLFAVVRPRTWRGIRGDFVRGPNGEIAYYRTSGRLFARVPDRTSRSG